VTERTPRISRSAPAGRALPLPLPLPRLDRSAASLGWGQRRHAIRCVSSARAESGTGSSPSSVHPRLPQIHSQLRHLARSCWPALFDKPATVPAMTLRLPGFEVVRECRVTSSSSSTGSSNSRHPAPGKCVSRCLRSGRGCPSISSRPRGCCRPAGGCTAAPRGSRRLGGRMSGGWRGVGV
jgi:hypothetical protein